MSRLDEYAAKQRWTCRRRQSKGRSNHILRQGPGLLGGDEDVIYQDLIRSEVSDPAHLPNDLGFRNGRISERRIQIFLPSIRLLAEYVFIPPPKTGPPIDSCREGGTYERAQAVKTGKNCHLIRLTPPLAALAANRDDYLNLIVLALLLVPWQKKRGHVRI